MKKKVRRALNGEAVKRPVVIPDELQILTAQMRDRTTKRHKPGLIRGVARGTNVET